MAQQTMPLFDQFSEFIGQPARVQLQDGTFTDGVVYCIDPETDHVALLCPSDDKVLGNTVKIVLAHNVRGIEKLVEESTDLPTLAALKSALAKDLEHQNGKDIATIEQRREQLSQFLTKSFVSYEIMADGSICVFGGAATIRKPFRTVECSNEQLLRRMEQLLDQFNQDQADASMFSV